MKITVIKIKPPVNRLDTAAERNTKQEDRSEGVVWNVVQTENRDGK